MVELDVPSKKVTVGSSIVEAVDIPLAFNAQSYHCCKL